MDRPAYDVLHIKPDSNYREVRKGYKKMLRKFTPEKHPEEFAEINLAYRKLLGEVSVSERLDDGIHPITEYPLRRFDEIFTDTEEEEADNRSPLKSVPETIFSKDILLKKLLEGFV